MWHSSASPFLMGEIVCVNMDQIELMSKRPNAAMLTLGMAGGLYRDVVERSSIRAVCAVTGYTI